MNTTSDPVVFTGEKSLSATQVLQRQAGLNVASLYHAMNSTHDQPALPGLLFNLFDNINVYLETQHIEPGGSGSELWSGRSPDAADIYGQLSLTGLQSENADQLVVSGSVVVLGTTYAIEPTGYNQVHIFVSNPLQYAGSCAPPAAPLIPTTPQRRKRDAVTRNEPATIHILVAWPSAAASSRFEADALKTRIGLAQSLTNQVFANSHINARVDVTLREASALKNTAVSALLDEVTGADHYQVTAGSQQIHAMREEIKADIVALVALRPTPGPGGRRIVGKASSIPQPPSYEQSDLRYATFAFALTDPGHEYDPVSQHVFAHELGHLLGARHDRFQEEEEAGSYEPQYDYVRGYSPDDRSFVTVMGYPDPEQNGVIAPFYSSSDPQLRYEGKPIGIAPGEPNAADASSFFLRSTQVVASYRKGDVAGEVMHLKTTVEPALGGTVIVSAFGPYPPGTQVTLRAVPRSGSYVFKEWVLNGGAPDAQANKVIIMNQNHEVVAHFAQGQATPHVIEASVIPPEAGSASVSWPAGSAQARVEIKRTPASMAVYGFLGWTIDNLPALSSKFASLSAPYIYLDATSEHKVEAHFARRELQVVAAGVPANYATADITDNDIYRYGAAKGQPVQVLPDPYGQKPKSFDHWQVNGVRVTGSNNGALNLVVTEDCLAEACYEGWDNVLTVTTAVSPAGPALLNIKPVGTDDPDPAPGYKFVPGTTLIASLYWWDSADASKYTVHWQVTEGTDTRRYDSATFSFKLKRDVKVEAWLTPKS